MTVTSGFFNAVNSDRKYNSVQISELFDGLILDGVYLSQGDAFAVTQNTVPDLHVLVGEGRAWFKHTWTKNDSHLLLTLETPDILFPRIDAVVLEVDRSDAVRANTIKIVKGTPAAVPSEPTMQHTSTLDQYRLANIAVAANDTEIINANITIKVGTAETPYIAGVLSQFDVNTLLAQWDSYFDNTWLPARQADGEAEIDAWLLVQEADLQSQFDAWLALLDDPLLLHNRQGGSPTNWSSPGTTSYAPTGVKMECGAAQISFIDGQSEAYLEITFPEAFAAGTIPLILLTLQRFISNNKIYTLLASPHINTHFECYVWRADSTGAQGIWVNWIAIGQA